MHIRYRWIGLFFLLAFPVVFLWWSWHSADVPRAVTVVAIWSPALESGDEASRLSEGLNVLLARDLRQRTGVLVVEADRTRAAMADLDSRERGDPDRVMAWLRDRVGADFVVWPTFGQTDDEGLSGHVEVRDPEGIVDQIDLEPGGVGQVTRDATRRIAEALGRDWDDGITLPVLSPENEIANETFARAQGSLVSGRVEMSIAQFEGVLLLEPGMAFARYELANAYRLTGDERQARIQYGLVLDHSRSSGAANLEGAALSQLAAMAWQSGQWDEAEALYRRAADRFGEADHHLNLAHTHRALGMLAEQAEDLERAEIHYGRALRGFRRGREWGGESAVLSNLAVLSGLRGRVREAREYQLTGMEIQERLRFDSMLVYTLANMGELERRIGNHNRAREYLERGEELASSLEDVAALAGIHLNFAVLERELGDLEAAHRHVSRARSRFESLTDRRGLARALAELARIEHAAGQQEAATLAIDQALALGQGSLREEEFGRHLLIRARIALEPGDDSDQPGDPEGLEEALTRVDDLMDGADWPDLALEREIIEAARLGVNGAAEAAAVWTRVFSSPLLEHRPELEMEALSRQADWLTLRADFESAARALERLRLRYSGQAGTLRSRARFHIATGEQAEAETALAEWRSRYPRFRSEERAALESSLEVQLLN